MTTATVNRPSCIATGCPDVGIYVACLASYNNGHLHGAWVDLEGATDEDHIQEAIDWVLATSPAPGAEEWAMHDSSGLPKVLGSNEQPHWDALVSYADVLSALPDEDDREAYRLACDNQGEILDEEQFRDTYRGCYSSGEAYAEELAEELGAIPDQPSWPLSCIDWAGAWRDLQYDSYHSEPCSSGGVHIFSV